MSLCFSHVFLWLSYISQCFPTLFGPINSKTCIFGGLNLLTWTFVWFSAENSMFSLKLIDFQLRKCNLTQNKFIMTVELSRFPTLGTFCGTLTFKHCHSEDSRDFFPTCSYVFLRLSYIPPPFLTCPIPLSYHYPTIILPLSYQYPAIILCHRIVAL